MDIPNANHFSYKKYTNAEMLNAFTKVLQQKPNFSKFPIWTNQAGRDAIDKALFYEWEVITAAISVCPNCKEMALDGHCPYCDYPNNK